MITAPSDGATGSVVVQISATSSDDVGFTKVAFAIDGPVDRQEYRRTYTYNWDSIMHDDRIAEVWVTMFYETSNINKYIHHVTISNQHSSSLGTGSNVMVVTMYI